MPSGWFLICPSVTKIPLRILLVVRILIKRLTFVSKILIWI